MNKLIFDPVVSGHHIEFLWNLIKIQYSNNIENENKIYIVGRGFIDKSIEDYGALEIDSPNHLVLEITKVESILTNSKIIYIRHLFSFLVMLKYTLKYKSRDVLVMDLNQILKPLMVFSSFLNFKISGILFNGNKFLALKGIKEDLTRTVLNSKVINKIFILNGGKIPVELNNKFDINKVKSISDPLPKIDISEIQIQKSNKVVLLYIGSVTKRKGIDIILEGFKLINKDLSQIYQLRILGKVSEDIRTYVDSSIKIIKNKNGLDIKYNPDFITHKNFINELINSDYVLALYKDSEISSGILGYSILLNKDLIGSNNGFIGSKYLKEWNGMCIKPNKNHFFKLLNLPLAKSTRKVTLNNSYMKEHSYETFYKVLNE